MTVKDQIRYWGIGLAVLVLLLWFLGDALLPFLLGAAVAYLTDPWADWFESHGTGRRWATVLITVISLGFVILAFLLIVPLLIEQIRQLIENAPAYIDQIRALIEKWLPKNGDNHVYLRRALDALRKKAENWSVDLIKHLWSGGLALVNFIALMVITPVVSFYLLMDWDRMVAVIDDYIPLEHRAVIRKLASDLDRVLAGFVRGQLTVCLILGTFYAVALSLIGLKFGLLIGAVAGLISFIPFVGSTVGGALSIGVAAAQFWHEPQWIIGVLVVFVTGQMVEGNFLTPKLLGNKVGLHPVWLMFALSAFGAVFGFVGLLIAVPAAAAIGVLGRFMLEQYKESVLYRGVG